MVFNVNVLCQLFEYICASLIASYHLDKHGSMHDMTLNRRWLSSLSEVYTQRPRETSLLLLFFQPLRSLLREVFYGSGTSGNTHLPLISTTCSMLISRSGYLLYDRNSHRIDNQLRNVFVARMCVSPSRRIAPPLIDSLLAIEACASVSSTVHLAMVLHAHWHYEYSRIQHSIVHDSQRDPAHRYFYPTARQNQSVSSDFPEVSYFLPYSAI